MTEEQIIGLYEFLAHGDDDHRRWLLKAIIAYFEGNPRPPVE